MKLLTRTLSLLTIASLTLFFANCGGSEGDDTPTEKKQLGKLVGTWQIESATLEGSADPDQVNDDYAGFELTLSGTYDEDTDLDFPYDYSTDGRPALSPWEDSGKWAFGSNPKTQVVRDDGLGIVYTLSSDGSLTLEYTFFGDGFTNPDAKAAEVEGNWTLVFTKVD